MNLLFFVLLVLSLVQSQADRDGIPDRVADLEEQFGALVGETSVMNTSIQDIDNNLDLIENQLSNLEALHASDLSAINESIEEVRRTMKYLHPQTFFKYGPRTTTYRSRLSCPVGTTLVSCRCSNDFYCSGSYINGGTKVCAAFRNIRNRADNISIVAVAECSDIPASELEYKFSGGGSPLLDPTGSCKTPGFKMISCNVQMFAGPNLYDRLPRTLIEDNQCSVDTPCKFGTGCTLFAVCRKPLA